MKTENGYAVIVKKYLYIVHSISVISAVVALIGRQTMKKIAEIYVDNEDITPVSVTVQVLATDKSGSLIPARELTGRLDYLNNDVAKMVFMFKEYTDDGTIQENRG